MTLLWTSKEMIDVMAGRPYGHLPEGITGISIDSRSVGQGEAFFAIKGEAMDGHDFATAAMKAGASVLVIAEGKLPALGRLAMTCLRPGAINLQWYRAGEGGYPYWHCELYPRDHSGETLHRHLLWTAYLNDDFDEGETEFLFQQRKIVPETGSLLIAPTAFTHTHRGNRPQRGDKYIATSWILFQRAESLYGAPAR